MARNIITDRERDRTPFECLVSPPSSHVSPSTSSNFLINLEDENPCELKKDQHIQMVLRSRGTPPLSISPSTVPFPSGLANISLSRPLFTVQSSPQLLNEICEEEESDIEDNNSREPSLTTLNLTSSSKTTGHHSKSLVHMRRKKVSVRTRGTSNISSSEDVSESEEQKHQTNVKRPIMRCRVQGCAKGDLTRRDSSEHSSDTDGTGGLLGRRVHHFQAQPRSQCGNGESNSCGRTISNPNRLQKTRDACADNSGDISEGSRDGSEHQDDEPQMNLLRAALKKLNVSFIDQEECTDEDGRNKLSSVMEENVSHSIASLSSSSLSLCSDFRSLGRKATSLVNISSMRWNSLKFLDLPSPRITEKCFLEGMMMMVWDDQEDDETFRHSSSSLRNSSFCKSMDANLQDDVGNFDPLIRNWKLPFNRTSSNISSFA